MIKIAFNSNRSKGFTLIEILIAMAISSIVMIALYRTFSSQQKSYLIQENVATMQQGLRASLFLMANDIRMAGYDSQLSGIFGITDIQDIANNSSIQITADYRSDLYPLTNDNGLISTGETIQYSVYDFIAGDGNLDIARNSGSGNRLLAENIRKFGLAFAFDNDDDGELDTYTATNPGATQHIIWAISSAGSNILDRNLDTNLDGIIDFNDSPGGAGSTGTIAGIALPATVSINAICAVRIWLLAETDQSESSFNNTNTYVVGKYVVTPNNNKRMRLSSITIKCRNLGL